MKKDELNLTASEKARLRNITLLVGSIATIGSIAGVVYAKRTGGGFWRYVGYWIAGGLVFGVPARLVALPFQNKILKEADKRTTVVKEEEKKNGNNTKKELTDEQKQALEAIKSMPPLVRQQMGFK